MAQGAALLDRVVELLEAGLRSLNLHAAPAQIDQLAQLALLLERWSSRINLTGHRTAEAITLRLVLDAAGLSKVLGPTPNLADLGSGAGFPGLPIAILAPETQVILVESRERRHHFQRTAVRDLGLGNATPVLGRAERLPPVPCNVVVAQAVAPLPELVALMLPWCEPGGALAFPASDGAPGPEESSILAAAELRSYQVPHGGPRRSLWVARRK